MGLIPDQRQFRLRLAQVGLSNNVSAVVTQLDGVMRGSTWEVSSATSLEEFLARPNYEIPDGTPVIRLDRTGDDVYFARVSCGPAWDYRLVDGHVESLLGRPRRYAGQPWTAMRHWSVALDVYLDLAPSAGVVIERLSGKRLPALS